MGARSEFKIRNLKFQMDGDGKGEKRTKARGKFAASGGRCASSGTQCFRTGLTCAAPRQRSRDAEIAPTALSLSWLFPIRCVAIFQEIYRDCVAVKRKERGCDGRQALGMKT